MSNPNDATIRLDQMEMTHLMRFFESVTVSNMFDMLQKKGMDRKEVDETARAVVGVAAKIHASLDAAKII